MWCKHAEGNTRILPVPRLAGTEHQPHPELTRTSPASLEVSACKGEQGGVLIVAGMQQKRSKSTYPDSLRQLRGEEGEITDLDIRAGFCLPKHSCFARCHWRDSNDEVHGPGMLRLSKHACVALGTGRY